MRRGPPCKAMESAARDKAAPSCSANSPPDPALFPAFKVLYLLDVVRNGIRTKNMRLTFTLTLFIAKAAVQILKPGTTVRIRSGRGGNSEAEQGHLATLIPLA